MWVEGYPRNDVLKGADGERRPAWLGIGADERVVLYAPTWRDDRDEMIVTTSTRPGSPPTPALSCWCAAIPARSFPGATRMAPGCST
ncbi:MAG: CDP-glycerol glycerophosphotransferase family protein [Microbacterium sp.]